MSFKVPSNPNHSMILPKGSDNALEGRAGPPAPCLWVLQDPHDSGDAQKSCAREDPAPRTAQAAGSQAGVSSAGRAG